MEWDWFWIEVHTVKQSFGCKTSKRKQRSSLRPLPMHARRAAHDEQRVVTCCGEIVTDIRPGRQPDKAFPIRVGTVFDRIVHKTDGLHIPGCLFKYMRLKKDIPTLASKSFEQVCPIMTSIRPRTDADLDACIALLQHIQETDGYPQGIGDLRKFLTSDKIQQAWVAESNGSIVGHISTGQATKDLAIDLWKMLYPNDDSIAVLSRLFVLHEHRKEGVSDKLVEAAVSSNAEKGIRLLLWVVIANEAAIRLYDRLGWVRFGTTTYTFEDGRTMEAICFASPLQD